MKIRTATTEDAHQIYAIYAPVVKYTASSFELHPPSVDEISSRIETYTNSHDWVVAEKSDTILGYAYATPHRSREAYRFSVETSVYVNEHSRATGIGKQLYGELFQRLKSNGYHSAYAGITLPNEASEALHQSVGFRKIGVFCEVGFKHDAWHDMSWWQCRLS